MVISVLSPYKRWRCSIGWHRYTKSWARRTCPWCGLDEVYLYEDGKTVWTDNRWTDE